MPRQKSYINPEFQLENVGFFRTSQEHPTGNLRSAGIGRSLHNNDWPDVRQWYSFPYYTMNLMLEGSHGSYRNENGFRCQLAYGDFFFTFPNLKHLYGPGDGEHWNELFVNYGGKTFDVYYQQKYFCPAQPVWHLENPAPWIERLKYLLQQKRPSTEIAIAAEVSHFLGIVFDMMGAAVPKEFGLAVNDWFDQACLLLTADLRNVDIHEIARELKMSYPTFRLYFTRRAGMPPYQYREKMRMEAACRALVKNPSKLYKEIAYSLGYARGDHFARQFKKHTGMLPGEYRKKFGKK